MSYCYKSHNGSKYWYKSKEDSGILHREDGPAIEWNDGYKKWFIEGERLTEQEFEAYRLKKAMEAWNAA